MYISVRLYDDLAGQMSRLAPSLRDGLVPRLRRAPGFKGYCAFAGENGHLVSVVIFDSRQSALRASPRLGEWMTNELQEITSNPDHTLAGETLLHEVVNIQRDGGPGMFAIVRVFEGIGPIDEVLPLVREHIFLTITGAAGFRGYYAFIDEHDSRLGVAVSLLNGRDNATEANERAIAAMRDRHIAPNPPTVIAGPTTIVAAA